MKRELQDAIVAVRDDEPKASVAESAAARVWDKLAPHAAASGAAVEAIRGCADVRALLPAHRRAELPAARALLVEDHLRECAACRAAFREPDGPRLAVLPWRPASTEARPEPRRHGHLAVAASLLLVAGALGWAAKQRFFGVPPGSRATVQSVSGSLQRLERGQALPLAPGAEIGEGEVVRTARGSRAVLRLSDGSSVEMSERAELAVRARGRDTTVQLERGSLIVEAAKRRTGRLRVASNDCTVSVTGTLFAVNRGIKGSRVSVLEGEVRVARAGQEHVLTPGDQWTTSDAVGSTALDDEIAWSPDKDRHLALLTEWKALRQKWIAVETPGVRYESRLLAALPEGTVAVASIPNYGESLAQAHSLFQERLRESQVLRDWWKQVDPERHGAPGLAEVVERVRSLSSFLRDEIVIALVETDRVGGDIFPLLVAEVEKPGLREYLDQLLSAAPASEAPALGIVGETRALGGSTRRPGLYVLLRPGLVAIGPDEKVLLALEARREGAGAGLDQTPFGQRILEAYPDGVGLLFAADLEKMTAKVAAVEDSRDPGRRRALERSGLDGMRYLIFERKVVADESVTQAVVAFAGARRGIASWLAAPAPMGALDFVSPHAQAAAAFVTKSPALVFDDFMALVSSGDASARSELSRLESRLDVRLRDDLAATLGGEFALALDGPLLPTPAWKVMVEVYDPARLQATIERLVAAASDESAREGHPGLRLEAEQVEGETYHSLVGVSPFELHYAYARGYLVAAPSRALVMKALRTFESGETLGRSASFRSLFPPDRDAHVSGLVYQHFGPAVTSLLRAPGASQLTGEQKSSVEALAGDAKPTLVSFYGEEDGIRVAGAGGAFALDGSDFALPLLLERTMGGLSRRANP
jgi:ferric-dicitrate binding protein FerR (iron transport regulator)